MPFSRLGMDGPLLDLDCLEGGHKASVTAAIHASSRAWSEEVLGTWRVQWG